MKKILALVLALVMVLSLVACGGGAEEDMTVGQTLVAEFHEMVAEDSTTLSLAEGLIANEIIPFMGGAMPMEAGGYLPGFAEESITGYKEVSTFAPMMGSIAFVGYIFELEEGADVEAFEQLLADNCNPRWQICVTADETTIDSNGNFVFFLMSPASFEEAPAE